MRKIAFLSILVLIASGCTQDKPVEKTTLGLGTDYYLFPETVNGRVKELHETNYWAVEKDGNILKGDPLTWNELDSIQSTKNFIAYFDEKGTLTKYDLVDENGIVRYSTVVVFENGKAVRWNYFVNDTLNTYLALEYDSIGFITGGNSYRAVNDTLVNRRILTHDGKGNYTRLEFYNYQNIKTGSQIFSHNEAGKVLESKFYDMNDSLQATFVNAYNDKGFMAKQQVFVENTKGVTTWEIQDLKFDDKGNYVEIYSNIDNGKYKLFAVRTYVYY